MVLVFCKSRGIVLFHFSLSSSSQHISCVVVFLFFWGGGGVGKKLLFCHSVADLGALTFMFTLKNKEVSTEFTLSEFNVTDRQSYLAAEAPSVVISISKNSLPLCAHALTHPESHFYSKVSVLGSSKIHL